MRWPGKIKKNIQSNRLLGMVDILPTIMDIGGGKTNTFDGKSFSDLLIGNDKKVNDYVYGVSTRQNVRNGFVFPSRMISNGNYKMIINAFYNHFIINTVELHPPFFYYLGLPHDGNYYKKIINTFYYYFLYISAELHSLISKCIGVQHP